MKHIVYKTTNSLNGKYYIGMHSCLCNNCSYLGSGTALQHAFKKYGRENFTREILSTHSTRKLAMEEERRLVDKHDCNSYNLQEGGNAFYETHPLAIPLTIDGVEYPSQTQAAKILGVDQKTIWNRVNLGYKPSKFRPPRPVTYEGVSYPTITSASKATGIPRTTLTRLLKVDK